MVGTPPFALHLLAWKRSREFLALLFEDKQFAILEIYNQCWNPSITGVSSASEMHVLHIMLLLLKCYSFQVSQLCPEYRST